MYVFQDFSYILYHLPLFPTLISIYTSLHYYKETELSLIELSLPFLHLIPLTHLMPSFHLSFYFHLLSHIAIVLFHINLYIPSFLSLTFFLYHKTLSLFGTLSDPKRFLVFSKLFPLQLSLLFKLFTVPFKARFYLQFQTRILHSFTFWR